MKVLKSSCSKTYTFLHLIHRNQTLDDAEKKTFTTDIQIMVTDNYA